jgi:hypothetical protein
MALTTTLSAQVGISSACRSLTLSRATFYRRQQPPSATPARSTKAGRRSARALTEQERETALSVLHSESFVDLAPAAICATLLDRQRNPGALKAGIPSGGLPPPSLTPSGKFKGELVRTP